MSGPIIVPDNFKKAVQKAAATLGCQFVAEDRKLTVRAPNQDVYFQFPSDRLMRVWCAGEDTHKEYLSLEAGPDLWTPRDNPNVAAQYLTQILRETIADAKTDSTR